MRIKGLSQDYGQVCRNALFRHLVNDSSKDAAFQIGTVDASKQQSAMKLPLRQKTRPIWRWRLFSVRAGGETLNGKLPFVRLCPPRRRRRRNVTESGRPSDELTAEAAKKRVPNLVASLVRLAEDFADFPRKIVRLFLPPPLSVRKFYVMFVHEH